ncbi:uncharacterized protein LOC135201423 isoform X2 [Macrobrachium nipponense]
MQGILCLCRATTLSFSVIRCQSKEIFALQKCRNISMANADLFSYSNVNKTKYEASEGQLNTSLATENNKDDVNSSTLKSSASQVWSQFSSKKYERFAEGSSNIIYDFDEEQKRLEEGLEIEEKEKPLEEIYLERGMTGVFDVEELVDLLKEDNAKDVAVIRVPKQMKYVDYMVIASCKSERHLNSMAQLVRQIYKKKKHASDRHCIVEGKNTGWAALDMGNIALHIMDPKLREVYDLETLWTVGAEFDDKCQEAKESDPFNMNNFYVRQKEGLEIQTSPEISHNGSSPQQFKEFT